MPEGPTIVILKEKVKIFEGKKILKVEGNAKIDLERLENKKIIEFKSWGKHFLICFDDFTIRIHFLMFGSYTINEKKDRKPRLALTFSNGELNIYTASVKLLEQNADEIYDWSVDVMNENWNVSKAKRKLKANNNMMICDALLDQEIFAGVGNIIKNEVLFITRIHPESIINNIPVKKVNELVKEARDYSFDFLKWKKEFVLKKHWLAYAKKICPRCNIPFVKRHLGRTNRRSFFCENCQILYK
ncbi:MAG TPA: DNA-formamidopyrimidine glycosylase family protein [Puia sp.]|jgi:endonuclease-8|nr:DNA-formamidopyrimidine glycosylase family protein [Puia sp.]